MKGRGYQASIRHVQFAFWKSHSLTVKMRKELRSGETESKKEGGKEGGREFVDLENAERVAIGRDREKEGGREGRKEGGRRMRDKDNDPRRRSLPR